MCQVSLSWHPELCCFQAAFQLRAHHLRLELSPARPLFRLLATCLSLSSQLHQAELLSVDR